MNKNKRGLAGEDFKKVLLASAVVIVLLVLGWNIYFLIAERDDVEICRISVLAKAKTSILSVEGTSPFQDLNCPSTLVKIGEQGIKKHGKEKKFSESPERDVKKAFADELFTCWYKFGEGNVAVFGDFGAGPEPEDIPVRCVICSDIKFEKDASEKLPQTITGFEKFLQEDARPGLSYIDYLTKGEVGEVPYPATIDISTQYSAIFLMAKPDQSVKATIDTIGGAIIGCKVGAVAVGTVSAAVGLIGFGVGAVPAGAVGGVLGCVGGGIAGFAAGVAAYHLTSDNDPVIITTAVLPTAQIAEKCDRLY